MGWEVERHNSRHACGGPQRPGAAVEREKRLVDMGGEVERHNSRHAKGHSGHRPR